MNKDILVINAGSSSLKFRLYNFEIQEKSSGICERIGVDGFFKIEYLDNSNKMTKFETTADFKNHENAIDFLLSKFQELKIVTNINEIAGIGHRIVQGGPLSESSLVNDKIINVIEDYIKLAPLHNKPELDVLKILINKIPQAKNVAVFDTSFHSTIPKINSTYAVPEEWISKHSVKKYGFHGTSYRYINERMQKILNKDEPLNLIVCHLGNGASVCCIKDGKSFDTTMGLTPLAGLIMGTRSGDVDSSIVDYISTQENISSKKVTDILNKESGLKALCGSTDFRDITKNMNTDNKCKFAIEIFAQRIANYIAIYKNMLSEKVDAIVFTGGIGENSIVAKSEICKKVHDIKIDENLLEKQVDEYSKISSNNSKYNVYVVRTNEEVKIAQDTKKFI